MWSYKSITPTNYIVFPDIASSLPPPPSYNVANKEQAQRLATQLTHLEELENFRAVIASSSVSIDQIIEQAQYLDPDKE